ncbi:MAG: GNAT family N-acetyltransferase [Clostridia bacterium]|nr:GNAT family N-acetyltransferase [Clostridia bacterium]MBQ6059011.1 GNAT family N-acetyltransferase [Clostridia bacterium]
MKPEIIQVEQEEDLLDCAALRKEVFGREEDGPETLCAVDAEDRKAETRNYLLRMDKSPVAAGRFIRVDPVTAKLQRLVVLKEYRKKGFAKLLLEHMERDAAELGYKRIVMDSALKAVGFYEKSGYSRRSEVFYEDNRPHVKMEKAL